MSLIVKYRLPRDLRRKMLKEAIVIYESKNSGEHPKYQEFFDTVNSISQDKQFNYEEFEKTLGELRSDKEVLRKKKRTKLSIRALQTEYVYMLSKRK